MVFAREFFDLQFTFAEKVRALSGMTLERALFEYTNLYVRFGLGREFDSGHEIWQAYLAGLGDAEDGREWTYRFYLKDSEATTAPPLVATFGCFAASKPSPFTMKWRDPSTIDRIGPRLTEAQGLGSTNG